MIRTASTPGWRKRFARSAGRCGPTFAPRDCARRRSHRFRPSGSRTTVSTKFWREHMGLPYHGTRIDPLDKQRSYRRYGFWDLLNQGRPYDVLYQLWTFGSQKILLWGNLDYTRRFAESTHLGDAVGFEIFAPLSQKGYGNWSGGDWHLFSNRELEHYRWEFERYWAYFLTFGLAVLFARRAGQPVLDGEFRRRFGEAASAMREAYDAAGWVIPFLTAVRNPSSSNFRYWPEMDTGGLTDHYIHLGTGDDNRFYRIDEYVADTLERRYSAEDDSAEMASRLDGWAARSGPPSNGPSLCWRAIARNSPPPGSISACWPRLADTIRAGFAPRRIINSSPAPGSGIVC